MKKRYILVLLTLSSFLFYTTWNLSNNISKELTPQEMAKMEFQKKKERRKNGYHKMDQPDEYMKFHMGIRTKEGDTFPQYASNYKFIELSKARSVAKKSGNQAKKSNLNWQQRGPANVPGRTRGLLVFQSDSTLNTWLAGSVSGGIWKTTDGGTTWNSKTDDQPNLSISYFGMSNSNQNIVYAGSGEGFFSFVGISGDGIFKSTDQGESWIQLTSTIDNSKFGSINRIAVDNSNANILVAATQSTTGNYIMKSIDGGVSWTEEYSSSNLIQDLKADPNNFDTLYASINSIGIIKSTNAGDTWVDASTGLQPNGRIEIAVSPVNSDRVYLSAEGPLSGNESDLYITDDGGDNWSLVLEANDGDEIDFLGGQGWYDNTIVADPYRQNIVYYGGVNLFKTTIVGGSSAYEITFITVDEENTDSLLHFTNFHAPYFGGSLDIGSIDSSKFVSVEIRFGQGTQLAHRFTVPEGRGSGVPAGDYSYQDYVEVPFQVWDIVNNKQLMVSFRDQQDDGVFNLIESNTSNAASTHSREYLFIHDEDYSTANSTSVSVAGGHKVNQMYFLWSVLATGGTWDKDSLPNSVLRINYNVIDIETRLGNTINITDYYGDFSRNNYYVHPDHHNLLPVKVNEADTTFKFILANDGGLYASHPSTDPGINHNDWVTVSGGYITGQFYGVDKKKGADEYIGGLQDNGTWMSPSGISSSSTTNYIHRIGGDGFEVLWNYNDTDKVIGGAQYNRFVRTVDGGATWANATSGLSGTHPFISKLENSNARPDVIFTVSTDGVFRSTDFGGSWNLTSITNNWGSGNFLNVEVSLANPDVIWAGSALSASSKLHFSTDNGITFNEANVASDISGRISGIETHPIDENIAYALFSLANSPKVLRTTDMGASWEDISGFGANSSSSTGFPNVAVYSLLVMPHDPDVIWAGTEIGIFESLDNGSTWNYSDNGLLAVSIWQMKVVDDQIVVATHGRGIWSVTIPEITYAQSSVADTRYIGNQMMEVDVNLTADFDRLELVIDEEVEINTTKNLTVGIHTYEVPKTKQEASKIRIKAYKDGQAYSSPVFRSVVADFAPKINNLISNDPNELLFDIQSTESYSSIELYLDDLKVGEIIEPENGQNELIITGLENKVYNGHVVGIIDQEQYTSLSVNVQVIANLFSFWDDKTVSIYPNPTSQLIYIELEEDSKISNVRLIDVNGKSVVLPNSNKSRIDVSHFESGIYFFNFNLNGKSYSERVVIQN